MLPWLSRVSVTRSMVYSGSATGLLPKPSVFQDDVHERLTVEPLGVAFRSMVPKGRL